MTIPALTTEQSCVDPKAELAKFFWDRSFIALDECIQHLRDCDFYNSARKKLQSGVDLSDELPMIKKLTNLQVLAEIEKLHAESISNIKSAWTLNSGAAKVFSTTIRTHDSEDSNIPCFDIEYLANSDDGTTKVHVRTWRRNIEVDVIANDKAAKAASQKLIMAGLR